MFVWPEADFVISWGFCFTLTHYYPTQCNLYALPPLSIRVLVSPSALSYVVFSSFLPCDTSPSSQAVLWSVTFAVASTLTRAPCCCTRRSTKASRRAPCAGRSTAGSASSGTTYRGRTTCRRRTPGPPRSGLGVVRSMVVLVQRFIEESGFADFEQETGGSSAYWYMWASSKQSRNL